MEPKMEPKIDQNRLWAPLAAHIAKTVKKIRKILWKKRAKMDQNGAQKSKKQGKAKQ